MIPTPTTSGIWRVYVGMVAADLPVLFNTITTTENKVIGYVNITAITGGLLSNTQYIVLLSVT